MRLSEAIRLGAMMTSQAFRAVFKGDSACAWGAALLAVGATSERAVRAAARQWPWAFAVSVNCPNCGRSRLVCEVIAHLNDDHRWTREAIGAWVGEIEPVDPQPPADGAHIGLVINRKSAKALGLTIPPVLAAPPDSVIE